MILQKFTNLPAGIFSLLFVFFSQNALSNNITLDEAVQSAYQNNQELKVQFYSLESSKSLRQKSVGGFLPRVSYDINKGDKKYKISDNPTVNGDVNTRDFNISQELFNGGKTIFDFKRANSLVKREQFLLSSKKQSVALEVIKSYINILKNAELLDVEEENIQSYQKILSYTKKRMRARDATKSDLAKAEADYISSLNNRQILKNNFSSAMATLSKLTGFRNDEINSLAEFSQADLQKQFTDFNQINIKDTALNNNPDLKAEEQAYQSAKYESYMAKADLSPSATFNYQISEDKKSIYFNNLAQRNNSVFVSFHIPIFNSGVEYANIGYANNKEIQEKYNLEDTRQKIIEYSALYLNEMNNLSHSYNSAKQVESANQVYFNSVGLEEKFGTKSIIDLLIARQQLYQSQTSRVNYYYDYILTIYKIQALLGSLEF